MSPDLLYLAAAGAVEVPDLASILAEEDEDEPSEPEPSAN